MPFSEREKTWRAAAISPPGSTPLAQEMEERPSLPTVSLCLCWGLGSWERPVLSTKGRFLSRVGILIETSIGDSNSVLPWQPVCGVGSGTHLPSLFDLCCLRPREATSGLFIWIFSPIPRVAFLLPCLSKDIPQNSA